MTKLATSYFRNRIQDHFEDADWDVFCRKRKSGYALYWYDDEPLAKLRPTGSNDDVDVYSWDDGRWQKVVGLENTLSLDEALEFITDDPLNLFTEKDEDHENPVARILFGRSLRTLTGHLVLSAMIGGAIGGAFSGPVMGAVCGFLATCLYGSTPLVLRFRIRSPVLLLYCTFFLCVPVAVPAAAGGALGGSLHAAVGGGMGWLIGSAVVGSLCSFVALSISYLALAMGLGAGVTIGMQLVESLSLASDTARYALVALVAYLVARICKHMAAWHERQRKLDDRVAGSIGRAQFDAANH